MFQKYGKSYGNISKFKEDFLANNKSNLAKMDQIKALYSAEPPRKFCKVCDELIPVKETFTSHDIKYFLCKKCGHLNGEFLETKSFFDNLYVNADYGATYKEPSTVDYLSRANAIYKPKAEFLCLSLQQENVDIANCTFADIGAGSGYFVYVMNNLGAIGGGGGYEVSEVQVNYANKIAGKNNLTLIHEEKFEELISTINVDVLSFIGVLEHVLDFRKTINAIKRNPHIKYLFFSLPLFSFSAIFEASNPGVFNRQLGGAHTHLFTLESINYFVKENNWDIKSRWSFGTDIPDLFRHIMVNLGDDNLELQKIFHDKFSPLIDELQLIIDKSDFCSEVHMLIKLK